MGMPRSFYIICALIILGTFFFRVNSWYKMIDMTSLDVRVGPTLSLDSVRVMRGFYSINRTNDLELFNGKQGDWLVFDGHEVGELNTDYGENDFLIMYGDRYYLEFRHFLTNSNQQHDYEFDINVRNDTLALTVAIDGPEAMHFRRAMNLKCNAEYILCNKPIDNTKVLYNMVEME